MKWVWPEFLFFIVVIIVNDIGLTYVGWWPETAIAYIAGAFAFKKWRKAFPADETGCVQPEQTHE